MFNLNTKMDKSRPSWIFSKFQNDGQHPPVIAKYRTKYDYDAVYSYWDLAANALTHTHTDIPNYKITIQCTEVE